MDKGVSIRKEYTFHKEDGNVEERMMKVVGALETLGLTYSILRTGQYGTGTPTLVVVMSK